MDTSQTSPVCYNYEVLASTSWTSSALIIIEHGFMPQTLLEWYPDGSPSTSHIMSILIVQLKQGTMYSHDYLVAINHVMQMQPFAKAFCYVTTVSDIASTNQPSLFGGAPLGNLGLKRKSYHWSASELSCYLVHGTIKPDSEYRFHKLIVQNKDTLAD